MCVCCACEFALVLSHPPPLATPPSQAKANPEVLKQQVAIKSIQNVLQTNVSVCTSLGQPFMPQFNVIFADMLQVRCGGWAVDKRSLLQLIYSCGGGVAHLTGSRQGPKLGCFVQSVPVSVEVCRS